MSYAKDILEEIRLMVLEREVIFIKRGRRRRATIPIQNKHHIKEFLDVGYNMQGVFYIKFTNRIKVHNFDLNYLK